MGRLFAGTPFDRPPTCDRCGRLESECVCPPTAAEPVRVDPSKQTARIRVEKRPKGKVVTVVSGLDPSGDHLTGMAAKLKTKCGTGGTVKDGAIELQGDHSTVAGGLLGSLGYRCRRG